MQNLSEGIAVIKRSLILAGLVCLLGVGAHAQGKQPRTVRDFFMLLPAKYFGIECCPEPQNQRKAKERYLKTYLTVEDTANGYMSASADAAQEGFTMALFKRSNGTYLIGLYTIGEGGPEDTPWTIFLDYSKGEFKEVSTSVVEGHDKTKFIYELPRKGTTVTVFEKAEEGDWYKGKKLRELVWNGSKFVVKKDS